MTALKEYQRLEASGLWRPTPDAQRTEVIVSIGDATLIISDMQERALTHWSLAAVARANPGKRPAIYHPDGDPGETLELADDEADMIAAIEKLCAAIDRRRPHPGRLRLVILLLVLAVVAAGAVLWLPQAVRQHAVTVVPEVKRAEIGAALFRHIQQETGPPCTTPEGRAALDKLAQRVPGPDGPGYLEVMREGIDGTIHLPGSTILIGRGLVEQYDEPDVVAGYLVAERLRAQARDPLAQLLEASSVWASFRLLTTGDIDDGTLDAYADTLLDSPGMSLETETLLAGFEAWSVRAAPYAYARDETGESTLGLIEADPFADGAPPALLSDSDWLRLQAICSG
ncbi:MAG: hypothetical protein RIA08_10205 [Roseovarius sp.]|uniref:hypothetical protein n=1 Tax=Roseobacteraceae TaxID=2854170 RepID=UPI0032EEAAD6